MIPEVRGCGFQQCISWKECPTRSLRLSPFFSSTTSAFQTLPTAFYTSLLYLPWVIKPLWSPAVDILKTRRQWNWAMQLLLGIMLERRGLDHFPHRTSSSGRSYFSACWLSVPSTHDIAADGFYILANSGASAILLLSAGAIFFSTPEKLPPRAG